MDLISNDKAGWLLWHSQMLCILLSKCFDIQGCSFCKILCSTNLGVCGICILFLSQWSSFPSRNLMSSSLSNAELKESICMPAICLMCYFRSTYMSVIIFPGVLVDEVSSLQVERLGYHLHAEHMGMSRKTSSDQKEILQFADCLVTQSTFCNPMDCSPRGSSVHGILQARTMDCHFLLHQFADCVRPTPPVSPMTTM